jgi:DNA-cytosine methyltransferase
MKFGSVCSGIEAASVAWESLGFEAQWFSEIEHFPSEVLKYRYPTVPNLGDMTKLFSNKTFLDSHIDLLVGGTPCQSFSVAGLRKGMEDPRGNLTLTFLSLIDIKKPKWIVWENVPGIISSNQGKDFQSFLDGLEEIGYICDVEILDAQYFGVAQRRRRVFVCGQSVDSILKERTITSALTIAQCLTEILHSILIEVLSLYEREPIKSDQASLSRDGVMRRMKLFGILTENCNYKNWQELLVEVFLKHHPVQKNWDLPLGEKSQKELTLEDLLMGLNQEGQSTLTEESLRKALEDLYEVMKLYTTLTLTRETIQSKISIFFQAGESISRLIARLSDSSPNSLSATLSSLTLLQELTNYARQTNSDIFSEMAGIYEVGDFLKQAQHRNAVIGYLGDWRPAAAVLFESESLQRDIKPSRKKREEVTTDAEGGVGKASEISCAGGNLSPTVTSKWKTGYGGPSGSNETGNMVYAPTIIDRAAFNQGENAQYEPRIESGETMSSLVAKGPHAIAQPIAFKVRGGCEGGGKGYLGQEEQAFTISTMQDQQIAQPIAVDTYNQTVNENTSQTIGSSASDVNHYGAVLEGNAFSHTFVNKGLNYAGAQERNTIKALSLLREKIGEKAFAQWGFGVFNSLQSTQILQSDLYGLGIRPASFSDSRFIYSPLSRKEDYSEWLLQSLREAGCEGCASQGWELPKQLIAELRTYLSQLPYEKSSSKRLLQDLWESDERPWLLREALSKVQEVWQSNANKGQPTQRSCAIRRLTPFETEILQGFPRGWTKIPYRNKPADQCPDGPRYKACGNSMAVPVMRWIGQRIQLIDTILNG